MTIKQRRLAKGWSQEELARHSGLSSRTIQRIEGGQKAGLESLKCLAAVFNMPISLLMEEQQTDQVVAPVDSLTPSAQQPLAKSSMLLDIEREAVDFAQALLAEPKSGQVDIMSKLEREAIRYAKGLLKKFGE